MRNAAVTFVFCAALAACAQEPPTPEQAAARRQIDQARAEQIAAECKLYKGTGVTPKECRAPEKK